MEPRRGGKRGKMKDINLQRKRKLGNRVSANRHDYGNQGFIIELLYFLGCEMKLKRIKRKCEYQKIKIMSIMYNGEELLNRNLIEKELLESGIFNQVEDKSRNKRVLLMVMIDNYILDILKNYFKIEFEEKQIASKPSSIMPDRRKMKMITLGRQYETEEIIEEGVDFYEMIKKGDEVIIELKQNNLELRNRVNSTFKEAIFYLNLMENNILWYINEEGALIGYNIIPQYQSTTDHSSPQTNHENKNDK